MAITEKINLHPSNKHRLGYDFNFLTKSNPALKQYLRPNEHGEVSIDFSNANSVRELNKSLLLGYYNVKFWELPYGYLCPPIPGRADYIHYLNDLFLQYLAVFNPNSSKNILDIGVGANCIYPLIGVAEYGWNFTGSDIDTAALASSQKIINGNEDLSDHISLRLQTLPESVLEGIILPDDKFDAVICNPPFHATKLDVIKAAETKWRKLGLSKSSKNKFNFSGVANELYYKGGEVGFLKNYIQESSKYKNNCCWFTSLISQKENYLAITKILNRANPTTVKTIEMSQGQKKSRVLAWTFLSEDEMANWKNTK